MATTGLIGLPGSGKTLRLTELALQARRDGRDVWVNFGLGHREDGYIVPECLVERGAVCWPFAVRHPLWGYHRPHEGHEQSASALFVPVRSLSPADVAMYELAGFRRGPGFMRDPSVNVFHRWEQIVALRTHRDPLGARHRMELAKVGEHEDDKGEVVEEWEAQSTCWTWRCRGCSRGTWVGIDELNVWAPARYWQMLGIGVADRWAQQRKDDLTIWWTAQHEARVDTIVKEVTSDIWMCRRLGGSIERDGLPWLTVAAFHRTRFNPALITDKNRVVQGEGMSTSVASGMFDAEVTWWITGLHSKADVANAYDTYEHVEREAGLDRKFSSKAQLRRARERSAAVAA